VRSVARGVPAFPELDAAGRAELADLLSSDDQAILRMLLAAASPREIARMLGLDSRTLRARVTAMIERLRGPSAGAPSAAG
jgi:DNA-binding NarL/FixJ family response regulator